MRLAALAVLALVAAPAASAHITATATLDAPIVTPGMPASGNLTVSTECIHLLPRSGGQSTVAFSILAFTPPGVDVQGANTGSFDLAPCQGAGAAGSVETRVAFQVDVNRSVPALVAQAVSFNVSVAAGPVPQLPEQGEMFANASVSLQAGPVVDVEVATGRVPPVITVTGGNATFTLDVRNLGNTEVRIQAEATLPANATGASLTADPLTVPAGGSATANFTFRAPTDGEWTEVPANVTVTAVSSTDSGVTGNGTAFAVRFQNAEPPAEDSPGAALPLLAVGLLAIAARRRRA